MVVGRGEIYNSIIFSFTDIREMKKIKDQYLRIQRLGSIGILASGMIHDLNNILAPILLSVQVLKKSSKDDRTLNIFNLLGSSAKHGSEIVKRVLNFVRGIVGEKILIQVKHIINEEFISKSLWIMKVDAT